MIEILIESKEVRSASVICYNNEEENCQLCKQIKIHLQTQNISSNLKRMDDVLGNALDGYRGCEDDVLLLHYSSTSMIYNSYIAFEMISRARQKLLLLMSEGFLHEHECMSPFQKIIKELSKHEELCENKTCQEHGWSKKKVIEVRECFSLFSLEGEYK